MAATTQALSLAGTDDGSAPANAQPCGGCKVFEAQQDQSNALNAGANVTSACERSIEPSCKKHAR